jgi:hypothetical protein
LRSLRLIAFPLRSGKLIPPLRSLRERMSENVFEYPEEIQRLPGDILLTEGDGEDEGKGDVDEML